MRVCGRAGNGFGENEGIGAAFGWGDSDRSERRLPWHETLEQDLRGPSEVSQDAWADRVFHRLLMSEHTTRADGRRETSALKSARRRAKRGLVAFTVQVTPARSTSCRVHGGAGGRTGRAELLSLATSCRPDNANGQTTSTRSETLNDRTFPCTSPPPFLLRNR